MLNIYSQVKVTLLYLDKYMIFRETQYHRRIDILIVTGFLH